MNKREPEEALAQMRHAGCTPEEIARFCQLRQAYAHRQQGERRSQRRSAVVRWLLKLLYEGTPEIPAPRLWKWPGIVPLHH